MKKERRTMRWIRGGGEGDKVLGRKRRKKVWKQTGSNQMTVSKGIYSELSIARRWSPSLVSESKAGIFTVEKREFRCALTRGCGHEEAASSLT